MDKVPTRFIIAFTTGHQQKKEKKNEDNAQQLCVSYNKKLVEEICDKLTFFVAATEIFYRTKYAKLAIFYPHFVVSDYQCLNGHI